MRYNYGHSKNGGHMMNINNTLGNSVIKTDQLEIGDNVFKYNRTVI